MNLSIVPPRIFIDYTASKASMGILDYKAFGKQMADKGKSAAMSGTASIAQTGDMLAKFDSFEISSLGQNAFPPERDWNVALVPEVGPDISFQRGSVDVTA